MKIQFDKGASAHGSLQWKGTNACMDFYCPCGWHSHWDQDFLYAITCPACEQNWDLSPRIEATKSEGRFEPVACDPPPEVDPEFDDLNEARAEHGLEPLERTESP